MKRKARKDKQIQGKALKNNQSTTTIKNQTKKNEIRENFSNTKKRITNQQMH